MKRTEDFFSVRIIDISLGIIGLRCVFKLCKMKNWVIS